MLAEYVWVDGSTPYRLLRSKTRVFDKRPEEFPLWNFDGSSTNQAEGDSSDCVLRPVFVCEDPLRVDGVLVMCEVLTSELVPHPTNTRVFAQQAEENYIEQEALFGLEQEYTIFKNGRPLGFPEGGFPEPQGKYYCSVGQGRTFGREIVEEHLQLCLMAGLTISGVNAEVMPGQWEFQIGPLGTVASGDQLNIARYLLERVSESHGVEINYEAKPMPGDWNGAGCHANFSTIDMRRSFKACEDACRALGENVEEHIANYGHDIESRLTGEHETCSYKEFRWGVSDRTASIRIPWGVAKAGMGYIEDRRPNADCDPYLVCGLILKTVMENR
jgi:glutamine synthetase|tara:strand:- start:899 stop:1888 length:990 start_codon:yes stop_codon:yes gene_type:complete